MRLPLLLILVLLSAAHGFKMPSLENIGDVFKHLVQSKSEQGVEEKGTEEEPKERVKRQDPGIGDESNLPYEARSSSLPLKADGKTINDRYMPVLANGHIGVTVYNDSLFLNGLYSGAGGQSHRAKIPAAIMSKVTLDNPSQDDSAIRRHSFNVRTGIWTETINSEVGDITHRLYVHAKYIRVLVSEIHAVRKYGGVLNLNYAEVEDNDDIDFGTKTQYRSDWKIKGQTRVPEAGSTTESVNVFWMQPLTQISIQTQPEQREVMIMAVDKSEAAAQSDFDSAKNIFQNIGVDALLQEHIDTWASIWAQGMVEVESQELAVSKAVQFSQYYLLSSLSPILPNQPPQWNEIMYGAARGSLGKGLYGKDYQGHVFWDNEMYILPAVLLFHPELAKKQIRYRAFHSEAARLNAEQHDDQGMRFPWESAYSGTEVTPSGTCDGCAARQIHVSGAVSWAIRQYYSATRDRDFWTNPDYNTCDMTREIARFFANRAKYNTNIGRYDIKDVMGPDDFHDHVDNNVYTNVIASLAIHWARYYACICQRNERDEVPDEWIQKALYLELPYSNVQRSHHQFEGFDITGDNVTNKQADTIMLTYPLNWNVSTDIMKNDLEKFEPIAHQDSPAMTWSWFAVGFKHVNNDQKKLTYFTRSYSNYMITPFKVWTEFNENSAADQEIGTVNYLPGMGAFLQSIIYGFAGIRIRPEMLEFHDPQPPPQCNRVSLKGLKYLGANLTIIITQSSAFITVHAIGDYPLILKRNSTNSAQEESLTPGAEVEITPASPGFFIYAQQLVSCDHPRDYIYMPWGYSPWINGSSLTLPSLLLLIVTVSSSLWQTL